MNKKILIMGASSDIGFELINKIADKYSVIVAHYCNWNDKLEQLKKKYKSKICFFKADLCNISELNNMILEIKKEQLEPDHIVYLPAFKTNLQKFNKLEWDYFEKGWTISVQAAVILLQAFLPYMKKQKYGKVVFMLTSFTLDMPPKYQTAYTTVKYALLGLMKSLAVEYGEKGITVNGISPDMIQTKFLSNLPTIAIEQYIQSKPSRKILSVEDVVPTFCYLLSEGANCINGENIGIRI